MRNIFYTILAVLIFVSCKKDTTENPAVDFGYDYYPLETGTVNYYEVTEINIDAQSAIFDTVSYFLMTVTDTPYYDINNRFIYPFSRYERNSDSSEWLIKDVWYAYLELPRLVVSEENVHILKLVFPVEDGKAWNGNTYNTTGEQEFSIDEFEMSYSLNGILYDTTITVIEREDTSLINKYYKYEKYHKGTGLIELTDIKIESAQIIPGTPIEQRILRGTIYRQKRIEL